MEGIRIVEVDGEMVVPLPQELVESWGLRPGMTIEASLEGRTVLLNPPNWVKPPEDPSS